MNREIAIMISNMKIFGRFIFTGNRIKIVQIMATATDVMKMYFSVLGLWFRLVMLFIFGLWFRLDLLSDPELFLLKLFLGKLNHLLAAGL